MNDQLTTAARRPFMYAPYAYIPVAARKTVDRDSNEDFVAVSDISPTC